MPEETARRHSSPDGFWSEMVYEVPNGQKMGAWEFSETSPKGGGGDIVREMMEIQWRRISLEGFVLGLLEHIRIKLSYSSNPSSEYVLIGSPVSFGLLLSYAALVLGPVVDSCSRFLKSVCRNVKYMKLQYLYAEVVSASS